MSDDDHVVPRAKILEYLWPVLRAQVARGLNARGVQSVLYTLALSGVEAPDDIVRAVAARASHVFSKLPPSEQHAFYLSCALWALGKLQPSDFNPLPMVSAFVKMMGVANGQDYANAAHGAYNLGVENVRLYTVLAANFLK